MNEKLRKTLESEITDLNRQIEEVRQRPDGYLDDYDDDKDMVIANLEADIEDAENTLRHLDELDDWDAIDKADRDDADEKRAFSVGFGLTRFC